MLTRRSILISGLGSLVWACGGRERSAAEAGGQRPRPGEPLEIRGQVMRADGRSPASGVMVYAYHTGIDGLYGLRSGEPPRHRAWMQTDGHGRFSLRTMIPASYPNSRIRPHVHYQLWGGGVPVQWSSTYNIDGSPRLVRQRGVWRVEHPLRAKATGDVLEPSIRHGVRDAPKRAPAHGRIVVHS